MKKKTVAELGHSDILSVTSPVLSKCQGLKKNFTDFSQILSE